MLAWAWGRVEKVASNRRILGSTGRVVLQRQSSGGRNPAARAAPEGTIDPDVRLLSLWNGDKAIAVLTWYATHPQSYYGRGSVNWDFVGMAREIREKGAARNSPHSFQRSWRQRCGWKVQRWLKGEAAASGGTPCCWHEACLGVAEQTSNGSTGRRVEGGPGFHASS